PEQSITNKRFGTPTCTAARPTPGAAYMVSNMLLTSFLRSSSNLVTGSAGLSSTGFGQVNIFKRDMLKFSGYRQLVGINSILRSRVGVALVRRTFEPRRTQRNTGKKVTNCTFNFRT